MLEMHMNHPNWPCSERNEPSLSNGVLCHCQQSHGLHQVPVPSPLNLSSEHGARAERGSLSQPLLLTPRSCVGHGDLVFKDTIALKKAFGFWLFCFALHTFPVSTLEKSFYSTVFGFCENASRAFPILSWKGSGRQACYQEQKNDLNSAVQNPFQKQAGYKCISHQMTEVLLGLRFGGSPALPPC